MNSSECYECKFCFSCGYTSLREFDYSADGMCNLKIYNPDKGIEEKCFKKTEKGFVGPITRAIINKEEAKKEFIKRYGKPRQTDIEKI